MSDDDDEAERLCADAAVVINICLRALLEPSEPRHLASARYLSGRFQRDAERFRAELRRGRREPRRGKP